MPIFLTLPFGVLAALMAVINALQVLLGRQLIKPSASGRSAPRLRAESAAAALAMLGVSLAAFGVQFSGRFTVVGALVMASGWIALMVARRKFAARS